jgi:hypothetical protein
MNNETFNFNVSSNNDAVTIRMGEALKIFQYDGFRYNAHTTDSFCRLLKAKAVNVSAAVVFTNEAGFRAIVDTHIEDRLQDTIDYSFRHSVLAKEWDEILSKGKVFTVKQMVDFLKRRGPEEIEDLEAFMAAVRNFKYVIRTEGDFSRDNNQNYVMAIKVGEAEGTIKVPEKIYANIEIFEGSGFLQCMEIEVDIHRPKDEKDGQPAFLLICPKFDRYLDTARQYEVSKVEHELEGFLVVRGKC